MHVPYLKSYHPVEHPLGQGREIAVHPVAQGKIGQHPKPHGQNQTSLERLPRRASAGERQDDRRDGDDGEQNEECGHGGVRSVKLEATRGLGGLHMGSAAQAGVTVGAQTSGGSESIEGLPPD